MGVIGLGSAGVVSSLFGVLCGLLLSTYYERPGKPTDVNGTVIAIDLGTTYSSVGIYNNGQVQVIPGLQNNLIMPSYVCFMQNGQLLVGKEAKDQQLNNPKNTIYGAKRLLGRSWDDPLIQQHQKIVPYVLVNKDDKPYIQVEVAKEVKTFSPEQICGIIVKRLKERAEEYLQKNVSDTVVSVPGLSNNAQREATKEACREAGLDVKRIVPNPTAAAIAYGFETKDQPEKIGARKVLVCSIGSSSLDLSVVNINGGVIEVVATGGNTTLGGDEFTARIALHILEKIWPDNFGVSDPNLGLASKYQQIRQQLYQEAERAKVVLSSTEEVTIYIKDFTFGRDINKILTRRKFEQLNLDLFELIIKEVKQVLRDSKLSKSDIDDIILTGGSTYIPKIRQLLKDFCGKDPIKLKKDDNAVLEGISIQAGKLNNEEDVRALQVYDVTPLAIGIGVNHGLMHPLIKRNSKIPLNVTGGFGTAKDNVTSVHIRIFEGGRAMTSNNNLLGEFKLSGIPSDLRGEQKIKVDFHIDLNGILHVSAKVSSTGSQNEMTVTKYKKTRSATEVTKMLKDVEKFSEEDEVTRARLEALKEYEEVVYSTRNSFLYKGEVKITEAQREKIEKLIKENIQWMEGNEDEEAETFKERTKTFEAAMFDLRES